MCVGGGGGGGLDYLVTLISLCTVYGSSFQYKSEAVGHMHEQWHVGYRASFH